MSEVSAPARRAGTVTMLFADIEGSTRLLAQLGEGYATLLRTYHSLLTEVAAASGGTSVDTAGDGAFFVYPTATAALQAAVATQVALAAQTWPDGVTVRARMGLHTGEALNVDQRYVGMDVHRAARITAAGHGGQVLLSRTAKDLLGAALPAGLSLRDLGEHRLKDLPEPERLFQAVSPEIPSDFPPLRSLDAWPNNLPRQLSSFVGRSDALLNVEALLASGPLLTLTGPGGVGKTRLALEVAGQSADVCPDGAWMVDLAPVDNGMLVGEAVASTLKIKAQPGVDLIDTLVAHIGRREVLLILDNCEHVLEPIAELAGSLLQSCSDVRILATSREALGIPGESLYPVPSLALPDPNQAGFDEIAQGEAIRLFVERARAVQPSFRLTEANARSVAQICQRLDGIPLAIELAAARIRALPADQIAARLDDRFRLLTGGGRTTMPRHRTLVAAIDWSYDLLTDAERDLFARLSVFAASFSLEAAEAVCAGGAIGAGEILDLVTRLIDRSLVMSVEVAGEARYKVLQTLRQYAEEKLRETGHADDLGGRHRGYFAGLVDEARAAFFAGPEPTEWVERLSREHENLRAALAWSHADPLGAETELRMAAGLWRYWEIRGHLAEGRLVLEQALSRGSDEPSEMRANALTGAGLLAARQGDGAAAAIALEAALAVQRTLGDAPGIAVAIGNVANVAAERGDLDRARVLYEESVAVFRQTSDVRMVAFGLLNLADLAARQGQHGEAQERYEESVATFRGVGDRFGLALALGRGATISLRQGEAASARERLQEALEIYRQFGERRGMARTLMQLGDLARGEGDQGQAADLYAQSLAHRRQIGDRIGTAVMLGRLADMAALSDPMRAARLLGAASAQLALIAASLPADDAAEQAALLARLGGELNRDALSAEVNAGRAAPLDAVLSASSPPGPG